MAASDDQQLINQIARVIEAQGWTVLVTDRSGPTLRVTIEHEKPTVPFISPTPRQPTA